MSQELLSHIDEKLVVTALDVKDIRWPTSLGSHGSDAMVCFVFFSRNFNSNIFCKKKN